MRSGFEHNGFRYEVAGPEHDDSIAALMNDNAIPGWISLSYSTTSGWHRSLRPAATSQTLIGTRISDGKPGGIASRTIQPSFLAGQDARIGWLGQLRIDPAFRNRPHLIRTGFDAVRRLLHDAGETPFYLASIIADNHVARRILEASLPGLPRFRPLFRYQVAAIPTRSFRRRFPSGIRTARPGDMPAILAFINDHNRHRDFAPRLVPGIEPDASGTFWAGLSPGHFLMHETGGILDGVAAIWDQRAMRSIVVTGYNKPLAMLRPGINAASALLGGPRLPPPGAAIGQVYLTLATVRGDNEGVWRDLVRAARLAARSMGADLLVAGFTENQPAAASIMDRFRHRRYDSIIYGVHWPDAGHPVDVGRIKGPKLEIGLL